MPVNSGRSFFLIPNSLDSTGWQWQPTLTAHDPSPPITLEDGGGTVPIAVSDTASGVEGAPSIESAIPAADAGVGVESISIAVALALADVSTGTESVAVSALLDLSDAGSGTESAPVVESPIALSDAGSAAESSSVDAAVVGSDSGSGVESIEIATQTSASDVGSGVESLTVAIDLSASDAATGVESTDVSAALTLSDSGAAIEEASIAADFALSDDGGAAESLALTAAIGLSDDAYGIEQAIQVNADSTIFDYGYGDDDGQVAAGVSISETCSSVEAVDVVQIAPPAPPDRMFGGGSLLFPREKKKEKALVEFYETPPVPTRNRAEEAAPYVLGGLLSLALASQLDEGDLKALANKAAVWMARESAKAVL